MLFRDVVAADGRQCFAAFRMRPDAVAEFVGDGCDWARSHPEHLRMLTWARLEGLTIDPPDFDDQELPAHAIAAIEAAQAGLRRQVVGSGGPIGIAVRDRPGLRTIS
jgi:Tetracyclin repressor-like, C-terminal domain